MSHPHAPEAGPQPGPPGTASVKPLTPTAPPRPTGPSRGRRSVLIGVGAAALVAGGWLAWRRHAVEAEPAAGFWDLVFDTPGGGRLALADWRGQPFILNVWATWCPPCVREMPMLSALHADLRAAGIGLLGLAADSVAPVREFLARQPVSYPVALAGFPGIALSRELGNPQGGLPFTVSVDRAGHLRHRHVGEIRREDLTGWIGELR